MSRHVCLSLSTLLMSAFSSAALQSAGELLKAKGLRLQGSHYVLPAEKELNKGLRSVQPLQTNLMQAMAQQQALEQRSEYSKKLILEYTQQRRQLNQLLSQATNNEEYNRIVLLMNELTDRITLLYEGGDDAQMLQAVRARLAQAREEYLQLLLDLRNVVTQTEERYAALAADSGVNKALEQLSETRKRKILLGPTGTFRSDVKRLEKFEGTILSEKIPLRREGGVFWVDTVINGKLSKAMVFDTGAGLVSIPAALATQAGLNPTEADPTIDLQLADGSVVQGKLMRLESLRIGKFTVENVTCAVLPPSRKDAPPLLGGSYLRHFTYKIDPDSGSLTLVSVESASGSKRPAAAKPRGRSKAR